MFSHQYISPPGPDVSLCLYAMFNLHSQLRYQTLPMQRFISYCHVTRAGHNKVKNTTVSPPVRRTANIYVVVQDQTKERCKWCTEGDHLWEGQPSLFTSHYIMGLRAHFFSTRTSQELSEVYPEMPYYACRPLDWEIYVVGGSTDPTKNPLLATVLKWAREQDVPKENIEKALVKVPVHVLCIHTTHVYVGHPFPGNAREG